MLSLNKLESISKKRKRVGRGGDNGGTSGRGHKGQKARSGVGGELKPWFEGGQMSLTRRLPKRGFVNSKFKKEVKIVNLEDLEKRFAEGDTVDLSTLTNKGLLKGKGKYFVKVLGNGKLNKNLTVKVNKISKTAKEQIEKAGGTVELVGEV
ncbi:50S ribosomal protein L15 [Candidatus Dependentiae bacterium]|nr:50S ribosomal protein L15 [Candidatus Dependentiae bacterium]